jgi:hypothetical protein
VQDLPRNLDAERALLTSIVLDPRHYARLKSRIVPDLFDHELHRELAAVFRRIDRDGLDVTMVTILAEIDREEKLSNRFRLTPDGMAALVALTDGSVPSNAAESYLKLAEEHAAKRNILRAAEELAGMATNGSNAADLARMFHVYARKMEAVLTIADGIRTVDVAAALNATLPPVPWIADGWLGEGDLVIFGGEWASGKSLIALDLAISVATGIHWMGRIPIAKTGPVLYVDEENNSRNVTRRLSRMIRGRNLDPDLAASIPLRYLTKNHLRLDAPNGLSTLRTEIETHRPVLVVLDSLIRFHGADENSNTDMAALFGEAIVPLATKYGCAFVVLDHMRKPSKDDERFDQGHRVRGAGDKAGVGDGIWTVEGDREGETRTFSCRKNRWEDSLPQALTTKWKVSDDESAAWIEAKDTEIAADLAVTNVLSTCPSGLLASDLYDRLKAQGVKRRTAQRMIQKHLQDGSVDSRKEGSRRVRYWVGQLQEPSLP